MRVRLLCPYTTRDENGKSASFVPGEVAELPKEEAERLKSINKAEIVEGSESPAELKAAKSFEKLKAELEKREKELKATAKELAEKDSELMKKATDLASKEEELFKLEADLKAKAEELAAMEAELDKKGKSKDKE